MEWNDLITFIMGAIMSWLLQDRRAKKIKTELESEKIKSKIRLVQVQENIGKMSDEDLSRFVDNLRL